MTQPTDMTEAVIRAKLIDPALQKARWDTNNTRWVGKKIPMDGSDPAVWQAGALFQVMLQWTFRGEL